MGGCRCTYKSCTSKSDGSTHLFHYPVFDKVRCKEWLVNARRSDLLNLTVAQLKNRVVCQHHFRDEMFMNEKKKDKLKYNAIPTENGLYCLDDEENLESTKLPITLNNIELDMHNSIEKKIHLPVKYVDFLTKSDSIILDIKYDKEPKDEIHNIDDNMNDILPPTNTDYNVNTSETVKHSYNKDKSSVTYGKNVVIDNVVNKSENNNPLDNNYRIEYVYNKEKQPKKQEIIKILSEKCITTPTNIKPENMMSVTPSFVITLPEKSRRNHNSVKDKIANHSQPTECAPVNISSEISNKTTSEIEENNYSMELPRKIMRTPKLTPSRRAAIEEKRHFNMKLIDVVDSRLTALDNNKKAQDLDMTDVRQAQLDGNQQSSVFSLESRLQSLENNLLSKIDQNSREIVDLKRSVVTKLKTNLVGNKRSYNINTQTSWPDETKKKMLYNEIAEFLSPKLKNMLYEELFIDKYNSLNIEDRLKRKKRK